LAKSLQLDGYQTVTGQEIIWTNELAVAEARRLAQSACDLTIFNFAAWAWPQFPVLAAQFAPRPLLLFSQPNPQQRGMAALLACGGSLTQIGAKHFRVCGILEDPLVRQRLRSFLDAGVCLGRLRGQTYGLFGGRPMGITTSVPNADQWMAQFHVDIEHIDEWEIVRRAQQIPQPEVEAAFDWCQENVGAIHYDDKQLTPDILKRQLACYLAVKTMCAEKRLDFCGIKGQPELSDNWCAMDLAEALLNDPYDHQGSKEPLVCAGDADSDGALTMQILKSLAKTPVLATEVRYWNNELGIFHLSNPGQHPTYFAGASLDPKENLSDVHLYPQGLDCPAGGALVHHLAATGPVTLARLARFEGDYFLTIATGEFVRFDGKTNERLMRDAIYEWPHAFWHPDCHPEEFLGAHCPHRIHAVYGEHVAPLLHLADLLGIEPVILSD
jgi:L-fucose isomerase